MSEEPIGTLITRFLKKKQQATKAQKKADEIKSECHAMEKDIIIQLEKNKSKGEQVSMGSVTLRREPVFTAKDWKKVWAWIYKKKDSGLVQKRLSQALLKEYLEEGIKVPGVEKMTKKSLSVGFKKKA